MSDTIPQPTRHIRWQEVYQIDGKYPVDHLKRLKDELTNYENSRAGQEQFALLKQHMDAMPEGYMWPLTVQTNSKGNIIGPEGLLVERAEWHLRDSRKILLVGAESPAIIRTETNVQLYYTDPSIHHNGAILLVLPEAYQLTVPKIDPRTNEMVVRPVTLEEIIRHETQHVIQLLRFRQNRKSNMVAYCIEDEAVQAERQLTEERDPSAPRRMKHVYAEQHLAETIKTKPFKDINWFRLQRAVGSEKALLAPQMDLAKLVEMTSKSIQMEAGCVAVPPEEVIKQTRALLGKHLIRTSDIDDATMAKWISPPDLSRVVLSSRVKTP